MATGGNGRPRLSRLNELRFTSCRFRRPFSNDVSSEAEMHNSSRGIGYQMSAKQNRSGSMLTLRYTLYCSLCLFLDGFVNRIAWSNRYTCRSPSRLLSRPLYTISRPSSVRRKSCYSIRQKINFAHNNGHPRTTSSPGL
jgi:hypothetical protein